MPEEQRPREDPQLSWSDTSWFEEEEQQPLPAQDSAGQAQAPGEPTQAQARRRLARFARLHPSRGNVVAAVLTLVLGVAMVAQARSTQESGLEELSETELIALLDDVTARADSLDDQVRDLEGQREQLQGQRGDEAAREAAQQRLSTYQVLAGTVPVQGPGMRLTVHDPEGEVTLTTLIDLMQELRDSGAEAIQIGGVRVVASSWVGSSDDGLLVDGVPVSEPYQVLAIGDSHTLTGAMRIPGGFVDSVSNVGGTVTITEDDELQIDALHDVEEHRYAQPDPSEQ